MISTCLKRFSTVRHCLLLHLYPFKNCQCQDYLFYYFVSSPGFFYSILISGLTPTKKDGLYRLSQYHPARNKSPVSTYCRKLKGCDLWSGFKAPFEHTDELTEMLKPFFSESNYAPLRHLQTKLGSECTDHSLPAPFLHKKTSVLSVKRRNRQHSNLRKLQIITPWVPFNKEHLEELLGKT